MRFRTRGRCDGCGEEVGGMNCLPIMKYRCPNCGAELILCPLCQSSGLECPVCEDVLALVWELKEKFHDKTHQKTILEYVPRDDRYGGS